MSEWTYTPLVRRARYGWGWEWCVESTHPDGFPMTTGNFRALTRRAAERRARREADDRRRESAPWEPVA